MLSRQSHRDGKGSGAVVACEHAAIAPRLRRAIDHRQSSTVRLVSPSTTKPSELGQLSMEDVVRDLDGAQLLFGMKVTAENLVKGEKRAGVTQSQVGALPLSHGGYIFVRRIMHPPRGCVC